MTDLKTPPMKTTETKQLKEPWQKRMFDALMQAFIAEMERQKTRRARKDD